jgi:glutathione S-transferase
MWQVEPNTRAKQASDANVRRYHERLDREFGQSDYVAGGRFTVADISLISAIDFGAKLVDLQPDEGLDNLWQWHARVSARDSVKNN